jgi:hypothetical protein
MDEMPVLLHLQSLCLIPWSGNFSVPFLRLGIFTLPSDQDYFSEMSQRQNIELLYYCYVTCMLHNIELPPYCVGKIVIDAHLKEVNIPVFVQTFPHSKLRIYMLSEL